MVSGTIAVGRGQRMEAHNICPRHMGDTALRSTVILLTVSLYLRWCLWGPVQWVANMVADPPVMACWVMVESEAS